MIYKFYFVKRVKIRFHSCSRHLNISEDGLRLSGDTSQCSAYSAFSEKLINDNKSVFYWTVRNEDLIDCYRSIGIVEEKYDLNTRFAHWMNADDHKDKKYHFNGFQEKWSKNATITLKLDYAESKLSIYKDNKYKRSNRIRANTSYYFAMLLCCSDRNVMRVIETATDKLEK